MPHVSRKNIVILTVLLAALLALAIALYFYFQYKQLRQEYEFIATQDSIDGLETELIAEINSIIYLPPDEQPTIATVTNVEKLKQEQPFFADASNGDKLLVYAKSQQAFLYRPVEKKLVKVGTFVSNDVQGSSIKAFENREPLQVEIRNGSSTVGAAGKTRDEIIDLNFINVRSVSNASRANYEETLIINLAPEEKQDMVDVLTKRLNNASVINELPLSEASSSAEILVIIAEDSTQNSQISN